MLFCAITVFVADSEPPIIRFISKVWMEEEFPPVQAYQYCGPEFTCKVELMDHEMRLWNVKDIQEKDAEKWETADALVFHTFGAFLNGQLEKESLRSYLKDKRKPNQMYVFFQWESPEYRNLNARETKVKITGFKYFVNSNFCYITLKI